MRPVLTIGLAVGLALLLTAGPGLALTAAARPRTAVAAVSITASDPARVADPPQHTDGDRNLHLAPSAPCEVSGFITTDTTWGPSLCDPYVVTGNMSVQPGVTLNIQPGTTVKFDSLKALAVAGTLVACGTEANRITFTSNQPSPAAGDWAYIHFANSSTDASADRDCSGHGSGSIIQYAVIEYAGGGSVYYSGALRIEASSPLIDYNTIRDNADDGIFVWASGARPRITNSTIRDNTGNGIYASDSNNVTITGNFVTGNSYGGITVGSSDATIRDNTITGNSSPGSGGGIYIAPDYQATISGNTITDNSASSGGGMRVDLGSGDMLAISDNTISGNRAYYGGGIYVYSGNPTISSNTITSNTATQVNQGGGIRLSSGSHPAINDNDLYGNVTGNPATVPNDLYNGNAFGDVPVNAEYNFWGTADCDDVEGYVWHFMDDPGLGIVDYDPCRHSSIITPTSILTPTLYAISNPDRNGDYTVDWSDVTGALTYTLHEDDDAGFTSPTTRYTGGASQCAVSGQPAGTWYYRVKAANASGESGWSNIRSTTVVSPSTGDIYEPDDTCAQANTLTTDGTVQQHTFHDRADEDWVRFTVVSDTTYIIQTASTGPLADTEVELRDSCTAPPLPAGDLDLGPGTRLRWTASQDGTYYLHVANHNPEDIGPQASYDLYIHSVRTAPGIGAAIVVAGRNGRTLRSNINFAANRAAQVFLDAGLSRANLRYLNSDPDPGGLPPDGPATSANLQHAIETWAADKVAPGQPLYLYLVDHGGRDVFLTDGSGDLTTAADLDGWLHHLETATECPVNVIVEACRSGSFIDMTGVPTQTVSGPGRVVIASTSATRNAYALPTRGAYFSDSFFTALAGGADLWTAFQVGRQAVAAHGLWQMPWLDDDGDAMPHVYDPDDGREARRRGLLGIEEGSVAPYIETVSGPAEIVDGRGEVRARVVDDIGVDFVWALVYRPSFEEPPTADEETVQLKLDSFVLLDIDGDGEYEGSYAGFTEVGEYRIVVYAKDGDANLALPRDVIVRAGWQIYLPLIVR